MRIIATAAISFLLSTSTSHAACGTTRVCDPDGCQLESSCTDGRVPYNEQRGRDPSDSRGSAEAREREARRQRSPYYRDESGDQEPPRYRD